MLPPGFLVSSRPSASGCRPCAGCGAGAGLGRGRPGRRCHRRPVSEAVAQILGQQPREPSARTQDTGPWACVWPFMSLGLLHAGPCLGPAPPPPDADVLGVPAPLSKVSPFPLPFFLTCGADRQPPASASLLCSCLRRRRRHWPFSHLIPRATQPGFVCSRGEPPHPTFYPAPSLPSGTHSVHPRARRSVRPVGLLSAKVPGHAWAGSGSCPGRCSGSRSHPPRPAVGG